VIVGSRATLLSAIVVVTGYSCIGITVAALSVITPRWLGDAIMRSVDVMQAFPSLILALGVSAILGSSLESATLALIITGWTITARLLAGIMRETMTLSFVEGARTLGVSLPRLMLRHVLPNALPALKVKWAGDVGITILLIGGLSFIGAGAQPPSPEWGAMVTAARTQMSTAWWSALFPGLAIALSSVGFALVGDWLSVRGDPELSLRMKGVR
jgi:peptide/nickel transport system permease protein